MGSASLRRISTSGNAAATGPESSTSSATPTRCALALEAYEHGEPLPRSRVQLQQPYLDKKEALKALLTSLRTAPVHPSNSLNAPRTTPRLRPHRGVDSTAPPLPVAEAHNTSQRGRIAPPPQVHRIPQAPSHVTTSPPRPPTARVLALASRQRPRGCLLTQAKEANGAERECPSALVPPLRHRHGASRVARKRCARMRRPSLSSFSAPASESPPARVGEWAACDVQEGRWSAQAGRCKRRDAHRRGAYERAVGPAALLSGGVPAERTRPHPATAQVWLLMSAIAQLEDAEDSKYQ
ncbi:hypothetical protein FB451DRAFT_1479558 [Mycena latifolia]|nr:hypothetical protein FB451DRAFT_1479558 [Mycena latifolia]